MAASASKRAKEDYQQKKEKVQEEKEAAKRLKEGTEKKKEKEKIVEMLQNARISRMSFFRFPLHDALPIYPNTST